MSFYRIAASLVWAASVTGYAAAQQSSGLPENVAVGSSTRTMLELQRSGQQGGAVLPMLGAASVLSYQRYLDSHKHPIPAAFTSVVNGAGGGGNAR